MSNCGISFGSGITLVSLPSVAISKVNPILDSDGVSVASDDTTLKSGRVVGTLPTSVLSFNRQCELKMSIIGSDLGVMRLLYRNNGAAPIQINVGRVDLFSDGLFDTSRSVSILGINQIKRVTASYYECVLRIAKI